MTCPCQEKTIVRSHTYFVDIGGVHVFTELDDEYRYWSYVEMHPAHVVLTRPSTQEAADALHWSYTDQLLSQHQPIQPPFSQEECQELIRLLNGAATVHPYIVLPFLIVPLQILVSNPVFHTRAWSRESYYESVRSVFASTLWKSYLVHAAH